MKTFLLTGNTRSVSGYLLHTAAAGSAGRVRRPPTRALWETADMAETEPKSVQDLTNVEQFPVVVEMFMFLVVTATVHVHVANTNISMTTGTRGSRVPPLDEMSTRIDDLEKNIADLMTQAGVEEIEAPPEKPKEGQGS
ncbi:hypothetical protein CRUP_026620 [Coryphaenoides rupestris]|nr:hypothetical protein CRUP_026620 [Coryphaenoides rupestris]